MTSTGSELLGMPDVVMDRILEHSDFRSIFTLRNVCKSLRHLIDKKKPDVKLPTLRLLATFDGFTLEIGSTILKYRNSNRIYFQSKPDPAKTILLEKPIEMFLEDVGRLLDHHKSELPFLDIAVRYMRYTSEYSKIIDFLQQKLGSRARPLKVLSLRMSAMDQSQVMRILGNLDSQKIQEIGIQYTLIDAFGGQPVHLEIDQILNLEQFKNAKKLDLSAFTVNSKVENFIHFDEVNIHLRATSTEDLVKLFEAFLSANSTKRIFKVRYDSYPFRELDQFISQMGTSLSAEEGLNWYIQTKNHPESVLHVIYKQFYQRISFTRIPHSSIPPFAVIQNW